MTRYTKIAAIVICVVVSASTGLTQSQRRFTLPPIDPRMTREEREEVMNEWRKQQYREQMNNPVLAEMNAELMRTIQELLRADDRQWKRIEPLFQEKIEPARKELSASATWRYRNERFRWVTRLAGRDKERFHIDYGRAQSIEEMTGTRRAIEELMTLVDDESATDAQIRKGIEGVRQAREKARKELTELLKELRSELTGPRQEALFLIFKVLD